ncbi:ABC transporter substrate-binding protein [Paenibacillus eucommiae]|uniref:Iron complex transport system substrate-binding protein n=1 Tax=Paenibacillus eucommiae TaxID=1355755 RepID=A0ABS4J1D6_9BACL|nr:ABC transporter substrate-binding protein [Paenibacillus eucommiae]MBP1992936.1 iron complex transport system substrate-binding protein [Paenibacillus eucommiae]
MKRHHGKRIMLWGGIFLLLLLLSACSNSGDNASDVQVEESKKTIQYTTITGEQIEIPAHPQHVVYLGDKLGDFLAMDIPVIGNNLVHASGRFYEGKTEGIVDVGNPGDLELIMNLEPDLIINTYSQDTNRNEALSKIAPTVPFNSALPYRERVTEIGNIFGKQEEAAQWIAKFEAQSQEMWDKLQLAEGETATVFLQLGKTLYVMGNRSLGAIIYQEQGFAIPPAVKKNIIDEGLTFATVSEELLPEYAGDHLFVLILDNDESQTEADRVLQSPLWGTLHAVKKGNVYIASAKWNTDGLLALDQLLKELPQWMQRP